MTRPICSGFSTQPSSTPASTTTSTDGPGVSASGILFVLAIRGLSSPETARVGNYLGMFGMFLAFLVTIVNLDNHHLINWILIVSGITIGATIGIILSKKVAMTDMPQMVAALNSMGGLSAVFVAWAAFLSPESFGLMYEGNIKTLSLIEMLLGILIGSITLACPIG